MKKERTVRAKAVSAFSTLPATALAVATVMGAACTSLEGPELEDPSVEQILETSSRFEIAALAIGLIGGQFRMTRDLISDLGIFGREGYSLPPAEPRPVTERLIDPLTPFNTSNLFWPREYKQLANAFLLLEAIDASTELDQAEKEAASGFTKTFMAAAYYQVMITHTPLPIPIDVNRPPTELAPLEAEEDVYRHIFQLFDEAEAHLRAGGAAFPFDLPPGFSALETPEAFARVNRALKVRVLKYRGRWTNVLATLPESFFDEDARLDLGAYTDGKGNALAVQRGIVFFSHPRLWRDAELRADGSRDLRAASKLLPVEEFSFLGITVTERFELYDDFTDPLPWIRNEELLLIRAEANLALGNTSAAMRDLNIVRERSGGLEPLPDLFPGDLLRQLLYEKRYSLMWEGGFTYLDARQYNRMGDDPAELPRAAPNHVVYPRLPYPINECNARDMLSDIGCQPVVGF